MLRWSSQRSWGSTSWSTPDLKYHLLDKWRKIDSLVFGFFSSFLSLIMSYSCCINVSWKGLAICPKGYCFKQDNRNYLISTSILINTIHCWRIKMVSKAVHSSIVFPTLLASSDRQKNGTYIRSLGIIFCPSLYHVTSGRGKEARVGRLMRAARPCVTVFLCSSAEKFPWTWRGKSNDKKQRKQKFTERIHQVQDSFYTLCTIYALLETTLAEQNS